MTSVEYNNKFQNSEQKGDMKKTQIGELAAVSHKSSANTVNL